MEWFQAHWIDILAVVGAVDLALGIITKWTPTTWDDNLYSAFHSFVLRFLPKGK